MRLIKKETVVDNVTRRNSVRCYIFGKARLLSLLLLGCAGALTSGCVNHMKEGTQLLEKQQYEKALEQFEKAAQDKPAEALRGQAMALFALEDYEGAATAIRSAVEKGAYETPQLYNMLAVCGMKRDDFASALDAYNTAMALLETRQGKETINEGLLREMRFNQIVCLEKTANWDQAKEKIQQYLADYPDDEQAKSEAVFLSTR